MTRGSEPLMGAINALLKSAPGSLATAEAIQTAVHRILEALTNYRELEARYDRAMDENQRLKAEVPRT